MEKHTVVSFALQHLQQYQDRGGDPHAHFMCPGNAGPEDSKRTLTRVIEELNFKLKSLHWLGPAPVETHSTVAGDPLGRGLGLYSADHLFLFLRGQHEATSLSDLT